MKRDINLFRRILLFIEADRTPFRLHDGWTEGLEVDFEDVSPFLTAHHLLMLEKEEYIVLADHEFREHNKIPRVVRLTWKGYDYLDGIRNGPA